MVIDQHARLPAVDQRLVDSESGYEILDGQVLPVSPAKEPHARQHSKLTALLEAHVAADWLVASDMLTRTGKVDDFAPDASVYPASRDPKTGGRRLERLAFEVVVSETLAHAGRKATKLLQRGVARVLAIDVEHSRALEWSTAIDGWELLPDDATLEDAALAVPLPLAELLTRRERGRCDRTRIAGQAQSGDPRRRRQGSRGRS
jgi:Uma2 family endonuclease